MLVGVTEAEASLPLLEKLLLCGQGVAGWARGKLGLQSTPLPHSPCATRVCHQHLCPTHTPTRSPHAAPLPADFVVDQMQAVKFAFDIARGMAFLHTLEPLIPRHHLNSRSVMVSVSVTRPSPSSHTRGRAGSPPTSLSPQIDEDMTARISMADVKFSFQCPGRMYAPAWVAPEGKRPVARPLLCLGPFLALSPSQTLVPGSLQPCRRSQRKSTGARLTCGASPCCCGSW